MFFVVDIDGVLAASSSAIAFYLNRLLDLGIPDEVIEAMPSSAEIAQRPEVLAYCARGEEFRDRFNAAAQNAQYEAEVQQRKLPIPGSVEGVQALTHYGRMSYATCRKSRTKDTTVDWLVRYGYPHSEAVYCCDNFLYEKYLVGYEQAGKDEQIVYIDDLAQPLMAGLRPLVARHRSVAQSLIGRIALLAYGVEEPPTWPTPRDPYPVLALPDWSHLSTLLGVAVEKVGGRDLAASA